MIEFKKGLFKLNDDKNYNFQLNRVINWDGGLLADIKTICQDIRTPKDWKESLIKLGDKALFDNRIENAIAYYRMSEFFMYNGDSDKLKYYRLAKNLFYNYYKEYFKKGIVDKVELPYGSAKMPIYVSKTDIDRKGVIVMFGGNDSYMEELFFPMLYLKENGYDVYVFEGAGQGAVLREYDAKFTYKWEEPVKMILDYYDLDDVVLIGISLGGMLAPRAAAFERRVSKVVAWSVFPSFMDVILCEQPLLFRFTYSIMLKLRMKRILNFIAYSIMKKEPTMDWGVRQGMNAYGASCPYEYLKIIENYKISDIADRLTQDILIMQGKDDHLINWNLYIKEVALFKNAKSITFRLFTEKEQASDHCQVGNTGLALKTIIKWLDSLS